MGFSSLGGMILFGQIRRLFGSELLSPNDYIPKHRPVATYRQIS
jgi:hypothetical protein